MGQVKDILVVHTDAAVGDVAANGRRVVGSMYAITWDTQPEPHDAKGATWIGTFADDGVSALRGRCDRAPDPDGIGSDEETVLVQG